MSKKSNLSVGKIDNELDINGYKITLTNKNCAILGWIIGDALGCSLEFMKKSEAKNFLEKNKNFSSGLLGGGPFAMARGQFTDDTEMGLMSMLVICNEGKYITESVAKGYHQWYNSNPKDIGNTTKNAVSKSNCVDMMKAAKEINAGSLSNGFLMRVPGMIVLHQDLSVEDMAKALINDSRLTHTHPEVVHISLVYGLILRKALGGDKIENIIESCLNKTSSVLIKNIARAVDEKKNYFRFDNRTYSIADVDSECFGFVGFAFWLLLKSLQKFNSYRDAILYVVSHGGDTDTNACIVGAVFGALYPKTIPKEWILSIVQCNCQERFDQYPIANPEFWLKMLPDK